MLSIFLRDLNHGKVPRCPEVDEPLEQVELIVAHDSHEIYAGDFGFIAFDCLGAVPLLVVMESEVPDLNCEHASFFKNPAGTSNFNHYFLFPFDALVLKKATEDAGSSIQLYHWLNHSVLNTS
jgi:hypothetical protein